MIEFNYDVEFMNARGAKPKTYRISFNQDYRLWSLAKTIKLRKGQILDVGCGGGIFTESLPYYFPNAKIYGCDVSTTAIAYAKRFGSGKVRYGSIKKNASPIKTIFLMFVFASMFLSMYLM